MNLNVSIVIHKTWHIYFWVANIYFLMWLYSDLFKHDYKFVKWRPQENKCWDKLVVLLNIFILFKNIMTCLCHVSTHSRSMVTCIREAQEQANYYVSMLPQSCPIPAGSLAWSLDMAVQDMYPLLRSLICVHVIDSYVYPLHQVSTWPGNAFSFQSSLSVLFPLHSPPQSNPPYHHHQPLLALFHLPMKSFLFSFPGRI